MTLISTLGALLKYELHQIGHRDAAVLVSLTPQEWADLQKSSLEAPASPLKDATVAAIASAVAMPQNGKVAVQLAAGDYAKVSEAHAAAVPTVEVPKIEEPEKPEPEKKAEDQKDSA